jgi:hypothetical protein
MIKIDSILEIGFQVCFVLLKKLVALWLRVNKVALGFSLGQAKKTTVLCQGNRATPEILL